MVHLATVQSSFEAKVIAARLGAEGIVWELRGNVDGPYPMGPVAVLVDADDLDVARELLLVEEVESSFEDAGDRSARPPLFIWLAVAAVVVVATSALLRMLVATL
jgi:Putative prokaryotic signal transducing protein